jgi:Concanavalin A-like lectin/glucanases superfamily
VFKMIETVLQDNQSKQKSMKNIYERMWRSVKSKKVFGFCLSLATVLTINLMLVVPDTFAADTANIVGNWHLDEGRGKIAQDSSGNFNPGKLKADVGSRTGPTWISRKFDTAALQFAGQGFVEIASSPMLEPANITLEAWVKRSPGAAANEYLISKGADACRFASYAFYTGGTNGLFFYISDGKTYVESPDAGTRIWDDQWHHIAGTYDGNMVKLYVDGIMVPNSKPTTLPIAYGLPTNNKFYIGSYGTNCVARFRGDIDEVRVWNQALTDAEIRLRAM